MAIPVISVVIPVYGVEDYIENCIRSVMAQTFRDFELILVDDGCLDHSIPKAAALLEGGDIPYRVICQENQGLAAARETGMQAAAGEWISCIDSDDIVMPCFLSELYRLAVTYQTDLAVVSYQSIREREALQAPKTVPQDKLMTQAEVLHGFLTRRFAPVLPAILIRRSFLKEHEIYNAMGCRFSEDQYFMWQLFFAAARIAVTEQPLYGYLRRASSIMAASTSGKILTGYAAITQLVNTCTPPDVFQEFPLLLPRWVLGALNSSARICDYTTFLGIAQRMDYRVQMKCLRHFPERRARILAMLLLLSPKLYYALLHRSAIQ